MARFPLSTRRSRPSPQRHCYEKAPMSTKRKNVVRFDLPTNPAFDQRLAHESDIDLTVCARTGPEEAGWAALERAHVYHVSAAKDELPRRWFVSAELLQHRSEEHTSELQSPCN